MQEETAHFLPQSLGEGVRKVCKDEVFLHPAALRRKVMSIGQLRAEVKHNRAGQLG